LRLDGNRALGIVVSVVYGVDPGLKTVSPQMTSQLGSRCQCHYFPLGQRIIS